MREDKSSNSSSNGCPVSKDATVVVDSSSSSNTGWGFWLGWGKPKSTANDSTITKTSSSSSNNGCPVSKADQELHQQQQQQQDLPASLEEAARHAQTPHPDQMGVALSTHRVISSIPRGATEDAADKGPNHQATTTAAKPKATTATPEADDKKPANWIYPSEQQFFNALRKKGWDDVKAEEIPSVLEIHNNVNERTWKQVIRWEEGMDRRDTGSDSSGVETTDLKLVRFQGRPQDLSPQAFIWTKILRWMEPPFDRHDWYVQKQSSSASSNNNNSDNDNNAYPIQRYVIDYYMLPPQHPDMPPTPYVDARPALDSPRAFYLRAFHLLQQELPGVTAEYQAWQARRPQYFDGRLPTTAA